VPDVITLKSLTVTFNDDTPQEVVDEVVEYLLHYHGSGHFVVQGGQDFVTIPDVEANDGK